MPELLLPLLVLLVLALLVSGALQWVFTAALSSRAEALRKQVERLDRQHARRMDHLSGRLGVMEARGVVAEDPKARPAADESPITPPATPPAPTPTPSADTPAEQPPTAADTGGTASVSGAPGNALDAMRKAKATARARTEPTRVEPTPTPRPTDAEAVAPPAAAVSGSEPTPMAPPAPPAMESAATQESAGSVDGVPSVTATGEPKTARRGKPGLNFEQLLGGRVFVWIGAVSLVLTGAFLLKYGYENWDVAPWVRVVLAGAFGLALVGVAEWLRPQHDGRYAGIAQAACGAGVAVLFGTVYAGHSLYGLIADVPAFLLLAGVALSAVVMSLRHGPLVALLGLVGGFALPPLLRDQLPDQAGMVVYLLALELGVLAVTRKRGWLSISALTLLGSVGWSLGFTLFGDAGSQSELTALLVMGTAVVFVLNTTFAQGRAEQADEDAVRKALWLSLGAVGSGVALLALLVVRGVYDGTDLALLG